MPAATGIEAQADGLSASQRLGTCPPGASERPADVKTPPAADAGVQGSALATLTRVVVVRGRPLSPGRR